MDEIMPPEMGPPEKEPIEPYPKRKSQRKKYRRRNDGPWIQPDDNRISEIVLVPVANMLPHKLEVQRMEPSVFKELVSEIEADGFDVPIVVIPQADMVGKFVIVDGVSRYYAAQQLGIKALPAVIKKWTPDEVMAKVYRRNLLHGHIGADRIDRGFTSGEISESEANELKNLLRYR